MDLTFESLQQIIEEQEHDDASRTTSRVYKRSVEKMNHVQRMCLDMGLQTALPIDLRCAVELQG